MNKLTMGLCAILATAASGSSFSVNKLGYDPTDGFALQVETAPDTYLVLMRGDSPEAIDTAISALLPDASLPSVWLRDPRVAQRSFYQVWRYPFSDPVDTDGDGIDDLYELRHPLLLDAVDDSDAAADADEDGKSNLEEYEADTDPAEVRQSTVSFTTSDRISIRATLRRPAARAGTTFPSIILIHQGGSSRGEWIPYAKDFNAAGYLTLAYDIRGHGASGGSFSGADYNNPNTLPKDLQAALAFLNGRADIDPTRIAIVGASVGGNLACVASQKRWVKAAVNISGKTSAVRNLAAETNLDLIAMYHIASAGDGGGQRAVWANELHGFTKAPRQVEVVPGSSAHGVSVFLSDPGLLKRIIDWLEGNLLTS